MHKHWRDGDIKKAQELNLKLSSLHHALFLESSPGPIKYSAFLKGLCGPDTRLPLAEISNITKDAVRNCLKENDLI